MIELRSTKIGFFLKVRLLQCDQMLCEKLCPIRFSLKFNIKLCISVEKSCHKILATYDDF
jgi:hypothetical protein